MLVSPRRTTVDCMAKFGSKRGEFRILTLSLKVVNFESTVQWYNGLLHNGLFFTVLEVSLEFWSTWMPICFTFWVWHFWAYIYTEEVVHWGIKWWCLSIARIKCVVSIYTWITFPSNSGQKRTKNAPDKYGKRGASKKKARTEEPVDQSPPTSPESGTLLWLP